MALSWLDSLLFGIRRIFNGEGVELPDRPALQFTGEGVTSITDDATNKRTVINIGAGAGAVPNTRSITVGPELTITPSDGVLDEDLEIGFAGLSDDAQHGQRGGADLHAVAGEDNGFMSASDKAKLDAYPAASFMATTTYVDDAIAAISGGGVEGVTAASGSPVTVDNGDPLNPIIDWNPTDDVDMAGYGLTTCPGLSNTSTVEIDSGTTTSIGAATATGVSIGHDTITTTITGVSDSCRDSFGSTKTTGRSLRNTTNATSLVTVQLSPSDILEGSAWVSGALKKMRVRWTLVPRTNGNLDLICEYDTGSGSYGEAFRYTTSSAGQFVPVLQSYGVAWGSGGVVNDSSGSGMFVGESGALRLESYDSSNPFLLHSDQGLTYELAAAKPVKEHWGTVGVNYTEKSKKVQTPPQSATTTLWTFVSNTNTAMLDNSTIVVEVRAYAYNTADPGLRIYFAKRACLTRNGAAPVLDVAEDIHSDHVIGTWGAPATLAFAVGTPTTNDVSLRATTPAIDVKFVIQEIKAFVSTTSA